MRQGTGPILENDADLAAFEYGRDEAVAEFGVMNQFARIVFLGHRIAGKSRDGLAGNPGLPFAGAGSHPRGFRKRSGAWGIQRTNGRERPIPIPNHRRNRDIAGCRGLVVVHRTTRAALHADRLFADHCNDAMAQNQLATRAPRIDFIACYERFQGSFSLATSALMASDCSDAAFPSSRVNDTLALAAGCCRPDFASLGTNRT